MGTSVRMIEATYGHLAADSAAHELAMLDAFDQLHAGRLADVQEGAE